MAEWTIQSLDAGRHDRSQFQCGEQALDRYLRELATQDSKRRLTRVFVATGPGQPRVAGFYTISAASFDRKDLPEAAAKRLPAYPVPAARIGRLAVDRDYQGQGLGEILLVDALRRIHAAASTTIGVHAVVVDAKVPRARAVYERYGFMPFADQPLALFLPMATVAALIEQP